MIESTTLMLKYHKNKKYNFLHQAILANFYDKGSSSVCGQNFSSLSFIAVVEI